MSPAAAAELWGEAYHRFEKADLDLLKDFAGVISKNNPTGKSIRLGSQNSQQQLIAFIGEKMKLSEQQSNKFPGFQKVAKMLATPKDLMMTASAASPPVNAAMAGIFLAFSVRLDCTCGYPTKAKGDRLTGFVNASRWRRCTAPRRQRDR